MKKYNFSKKWYMMYRILNTVYQLLVTSYQIVVSISVEVFQVECGNEVFEQRTDVYKYKNDQY